MDFNKFRLHIIKWEWKLQFLQIFSWMFITLFTWKIKQTYIFVYMYVFGQTNSNRMICHSYFKKYFCWFRILHNRNFSIGYFPRHFPSFFSHFEVGRVGTISFPVLACVSCFVVHISCLWHNVVTFFLKEHPYFRAPPFLQKKSIFSFHILYFSIKIVCILFLFYLIYSEKKLIQVSRKSFEILSLGRECAKIL